MIINNKLSINNDFNQKDLLNLASQNADPCFALPCYVMIYHVFSELNLHQLGVSKLVSKKWQELASTPILWQSAVYREIAFSSKNWAEWKSDLVKEVDRDKEMLSLPKNIAEKLSHSAFPGKKIKDTHVLVRMLEGLTIRKLGELAKKYFPNTFYGYALIQPPLIDQIGDEVSDESSWLLMTKEVFLPSLGKDYFEQKEMIDQLSKTTGSFYSIPSVLEAATCILAEYAHFGNRLLKEEMKENKFIRCQHTIQGGEILIGNFVKNEFSNGGLCIISNFINSFTKREHIGVAVLQKL